jgi:hypothetical protein
MTRDPIGGLLDATLGRWSELDTDWQGVLVAAVIGLLVGEIGVSIPW